MVAAPKHVYSVVAVNASPATVKVMVLYKLPDATTDTVAVDIEAGKSHEFEQRVVSMGTYDATAIVEHIAVQFDAASDPVAYDAPFPGVSSPVKTYHVNIASRDSITLTV